MWSIPVEVLDYEAEIARLRERVAELEAFQRGLSPDWASAPDWANYWAMDRDGTSFWYALKPTLKDYYWNTNGPYSQCEACLAERWIDSLCHRPAVTTESVACGKGDSHQ